jgi:hypothetical protein
MVVLELNVGRAQGRAAVAPALRGPQPKFVWPGIRSFRPTVRLGPLLARGPPMMPID